MLCEDVFEFIQNNVAIAKAHNPSDQKSQQAFRSAAHYMAVLVAFMTVDKQTNTSGEEALRSYVPVGAMYRNDVQQALDKFYDFVTHRAKELDFGRYEPTRLMQQYDTFFSKGGEEQWRNVAMTLQQYFRQRQDSIHDAEQAQQQGTTAFDKYEKRAS